MNTESFDVLPVTDPRWDEALEQVEHDFYHRRSYHDLAQWNGEGEAFAAVYRRGADCLVWPYLRRPIAGTDLFDVTSVMGYAGPLSSRTDGSRMANTLVHDAWQMLCRHWADQRVVGVFTTFHPLLANAPLAASFPGEDDGPTPAITSPGRTVSIDLSGTPAERMAAYEKETRYEIRRARRRGVDVFVDSDRTHLDDLVRMYNETMRRNGTGPRYRFSADYLVRLFAALGEDAHLLVATYAGEVVCAMVVVVSGGLGHAHVTGVSPEHFRLSPLNATLAAAADFVQEQGARVMHLGAGRGAREDSLFEFKRRIGSVLRPYHVGRWVIDSASYRRLCETAGEEVVADPPYFPAYRHSPA